METEIHNIFPIAIMEFKIPLSTKKLQEDLKKYKSTMKGHPLLEGGGSSTYDPNDSILEKTEFNLLKKEFEICLEEYKELTGLRKFQIINSWLSIMNKNVSLREHRHQASIISGAYYPKCPVGSVGLTLNNPLEPYKMCELYSKVTEFNAVKGILPVQEGYLYLFPSWLEHGTNVNTTDERYVISFNTMHFETCGHNKEWFTT
jgi:uncharacterized protein (TIGR02466 family)